MKKVAQERTIVEPARSPAELEKIFQFRYQVYVDEMGEKQRFADHEGRRIEDPLDPSAINIAAWHESIVIGHVRVNFSRNAPLDYYSELLGMAFAGDDHPGATSVSTRLMVASRFRGSNVTVRLCVAAFRAGLEHGIRWNFITCREHLVPLYQGLGFREYRQIVEHDEYGEVMPLVLKLDDLPHLEALGSPFAAVYRAWANGRVPRNYGTA